MNFIRNFAAGDYVCIYYRGNRQQSREYYDKVLQFINHKGYRIIGDSIERAPLLMNILREKDFHLTRIQIPVEI